MKKRELLLRYLLLLVGIFFISLGIAFAKHSNLGISPVTSVANVFSIKFTQLTIGTWLMIWNCTMILIQIIILKKEFKFIQFLQIPISLILGVFTDFNLSYVSLIPTNIYLLRLVLVFVGVIIISFGTTLTIISSTVMNVGESLVSVISHKMNKEFGNVKTVFDLSCVTFSVILSLIFFDFKVLGIREGTVIIAIFTGLCVKKLTKILSKPINNFIKKRVN